MKNVTCIQPLEKGLRTACDIACDGIQHLLRVQVILSAVLSLVLRPSRATHEEGLVYKVGILGCALEMHSPIRLLSLKISCDIKPL